MKNKKENLHDLKMILALSIVCPIGFCAGFLGARGAEKVISNINEQVERQKYGDMYDLMLKDSFGKTLTLENFKEPITVRIAENFSDNEKKQLVSAIDALDEISPNLNYKLLDDENYTITANINVVKSENLVNEAALAATHLDNNLMAKIVYPITIDIKKSFSDYYAKIDQSSDDLLCHVMKHEMMHTLGFADLYDQKHFDKSIMWYSTENTHVVKDYTERDKACINKLYDDMLVSVQHPSKMCFTVENTPIYKHQNDELELI